MLQYGYILYHMQPYTSICQHTLAYAAIAHASIYASTCCVTMLEHFRTHHTKCDPIFKICAAAPTRSHTFHRTVFSSGVSGFRRVPYCITRCVQNIVKHKENTLAPFSARKHCRRGVSKIIGSKIDAPLIGTHDNSILICNVKGKHIAKYGPLKFGHLVARCRFSTLRFLWRPDL